MDITKTWADVEARALDCPFVQAVVHLHRSGVSREAALIAGVMVLSEALAQTQAVASRLMANLPMSIQGGQ